MNDKLKELFSMRRKDAEDQERRFSYRDILRTLGDVPPAIDFGAPFKRRDAATRIIAEIKKADFPNGVIRDDFHAIELGEELSDAGASALSVAVEPHVHLGSEDNFRRIRSVSSLPILYKDCISSRYQIAEARMAGADAIELVAAVLNDADLVALKAHAHELGMSVLCVAESAKEIERALNLEFKIIGVVCRDRKTGAFDARKFAELVQQLPRSIVKIAMGGIESREDVEAAKAAGADAILVGAALMRSPRPGLKLRELRMGNRE